MTIKARAKAKRKGRGSNDINSNIKNNGAEVKTNSKAQDTHINTAAHSTKTIRSTNKATRSGTATKDAAASKRKRSAKPANTAMSYKQIKVGGLDKASSSDKHKDKARMEQKQDKVAEHDLFGMNYNLIPEAMFDSYNQSMELAQDFVNSENFVRMMKNFQQFKQDEITTEDTAGQSPLLRSYNLKLAEWQKMLKTMQSITKGAVESRLKAHNRWMSNASHDIGGLFTNIMRSADDQDKIDSMHKFLLSQIESNKTQLQDIVTMRHDLLSEMLAMNNGYFMNLARHIYNTTVQNWKQPGATHQARHG